MAASNHDAGDVTERAKTKRAAQAPSHGSDGASVILFSAGGVTACAVTAAVALLLYTGAGFLRTAGLLLALAAGSFAAGLWAGDEKTRSTRSRTITFMLTLFLACAFALRWTAVPALREIALAGSLAVLIVLAMPAYAAGSLFASLQRHASVRHAAVLAIAGAAAGFAVTTAVFIPRLDAWGVFFAAAVLLLPAAVLPVSMSEPNRSGRIMHDRVAVVTGVGAEGQLGYAIAKALVDAGARVVIAGLTDDVRGLADKLGAREQVVGVRADLTTADGAAAVAAAAQSLGRLDALVNVAGGLTVIDSIEHTDSAKFRREMAINAETCLLMSRATLPMLRESRGSIINFASPAGEHAMAQMGAYSAAKAAVIAITRSLAMEELQNGVRVNAIAPGMIDTEQNRASAPEDARFVTRQQVADVVMFLCSDRSTGITGETIHVPGPTLT